MFLIWHSAYKYIIPAHGKELVKTDLQIEVPFGTYGRVAPRSGLAWKNHIDVGAGVIDADYRWVELQIFAVIKISLSFPLYIFI